MIKIFIGSNEKYRFIEPVIEAQIKKYTSSPVEITFMHPRDYGLVNCGCTGFTNLRYIIPDLCGRKGFAIYLDVDMLVLWDINELWRMKEYGKWVCMQDGSTEVSVICCETQGMKLGYNARKHEHEQWINKSNKIPSCWNVEDEVKPGMKLLHFTNLKTQPWFADTNKESHACPEAGSLDTGRAGGGQWIRTPLALP